MTAPVVNQAEPEADLHLIADAARRIADGYENELAEEQDAGPRMFRAVARLLAAIAAIALLAYSALNLKG